MTPAGLLRRAADVIERDGWWCGEPEEESGETHCALTAIDAAADEAVDAGEMERAEANAVAFAATNTLRRRLGLGAEGGSVAEWNDDPKRKVGQVLSKLRGRVRS